MGVQTVLQDIQSGYLSATTFTANNNIITTALDSALDRTGSVNNAMLVDLDMGLKNQLNLKDGVNPKDGVNLSQVQNMIFSNSTGLISRLHEKIIAVAGQTNINLSSLSYVPNTNNIMIFVNGIARTDYIEDSYTSITFTNPLSISDTIDIYVNESTTSQVTNAQNVYSTRENTDIETAISYRNKVYASIDILKNSSSFSVGDTVQTLSYTANYFGGGNTYEVIDGVSSRPPEDGGYIIYLTGGSGFTYLLGKFPNGSNVLQFGAIPSAVVDNAVPINNYISKFGDLILEEGVYGIGSGINLISDLSISSKGKGATLIALTDNFNMITSGFSANISNISISNITLDGGGQTTDIYTGNKNIVGIYLSGVKNSNIYNMNIKNMGIINKTTPSIDAGWGGFGIVIESRNGEVYNVSISNCTIKDIAGTGISAGDGIYIAGYAAGTGLSDVGITIDSCYVSSCGRHCYTVAGGNGQTIPSNIRYINCKGDKAGSSGIDIESGDSVYLISCNFELCGNYQKYSNPVLDFGATYRLLAAIAFDNNSNNINIINTKVTTSYYGVTIGSSSNVFLSGLSVYSSVVSDIIQILANAPQKFRVKDCSFNSDLETLNILNSSLNKDKQASFDSCSFAGQVTVNELKYSSFSGCVFNKGVRILGSSKQFIENRFVNCNFFDSGVDGIYVNSTLSENCSVIGCHFIGNGTMQYGINFAKVDCAINWIIEGCQFYNISTAGIGGIYSLSRSVQIIKGNSFSYSANGVVFTGSINDMIIDSNIFSDISGWAISIVNGVGYTSNLTISNNTVKGATINGIQLTTTTGFLDYCILNSNNVRGSSGTSWDITAGVNLNGFEVNNIVV